MATRINSAGYRLKHGIHEVTRAVKALGTNRALDRRTTTDKALARWRDELIADLGGNVSTAKDAIISLAVKTKLILDSIDVWLLQQPALIDKRKRALLPAVRERQALADALARYLAMLGLERRHKVKILQDLLTGDSDKPATVNCSRRLMETTALTTSSAETEATPSAEPRTFARTALTHVQNDSGRCANPFCDEQRKIKPRGRHGRYCSPPCRMDGVTRYDAKALLNKVGIVRFHELLDQA